VTEGKRETDVGSRGSPNECIYISTPFGPVFPKAWLGLAT
jgi:hypothetical protein